MEGFWSAHVLWFVTGAAFLVAELALPGFVLFFFALGAFCAAAAAWGLGLGVGGQFVLFLAASLAGVALLRRLFLRVFRGASRGPDGQDTPGPAQGPDELAAGRSAVVSRAIAPGVPGEIRFRGSFWRAHATQALAEGEQVVIIGPAANDAGAYAVRPAQEEEPHA